MPLSPAPLSILYTETSMCAYCFRFLDAAAFVMIRRKSITLISNILLRVPCLCFDQLVIYRVHNKLCKYYEMKIFLFCYPLL